MDDKVLYAIPTMKCNLNCDHCFIVDTPEEFNRDKFISKLNNFNGEIILFGGEITSNRERMNDVIKTNKMDGISRISSISTNLIILDSELIEFYKTLHHVSTSWNPHRFKYGSMFDKWLANCYRLSRSKINHTVMITLTNDLFEISPNEFIKIAKLFDNEYLLEIKFEHYVGEVTKEYFEKADLWLCEVYKLWDLNTKFEIGDRICSWQYNCDNIYTLYPDGSLVNRCPHNLPGTTPVECYTCDRVKTCRPCKLQPYCSYPKHLAELIKGGGSDGLSLLSSQ